MLRMFLNMFLFKRFQKFTNFSILLHYLINENTNVINAR